MEKGTLFYNVRLSRMDIRFDFDKYYGGLRCGECFEVYIDEKWTPTRVEKYEGWYLVGISRDTCLTDLLVRI